MNSRFCSDEPFVFVEDDDLKEFAGPPDEPRNEKGEWTTGYESETTKTLKNLLDKAKAQKITEPGALKEHNDFIEVLKGHIKDSQESDAKTHEKMKSLKSSGVADAFASYNSPGLGKAMQKWRDGLSNEEVNAIAVWSSSSSAIRNIQKGVNLKSGSGEAWREFATNFHAAMQRAPIYAGAVYRGQHDQSAEDVAKLKVGSIVVMPADTSSSAWAGRAEEFMESNHARSENSQSNLLEIHGKTSRCLNPQADPGLGLGIAKEREVILPMGTRYRVTKFTPQADHENHVVLEEIE